MIPLVELPQLVQHYAPHFEGVFSPPAFLQFQRYISGLIVSENKTVEGINRLCLFAPRNQSSLNRWLHESPFSVKELNQARLRLLQSLSGTRIKPHGVLSVDDTLLAHEGQHFEHIASLYDPAQECYVWAHNLVTIHYSDDLTDYPGVFQLWKPPDLAHLEAGLVSAGVRMQPGKQALKVTDPIHWRRYLLGVWRRHQHKPEVATLYESKLRIAQALLEQWVQAHPEERLPVTFDTWYTQPAFCRYLDQTLHLSYVGTLSATDEVLLQRGRQPLGDFAQHLRQEHQAALAHQQRGVFQPTTIRYKGTQETYYSYCATHRIPHFGKQRLVINYHHADLSDDPVFYITNRLYWQATGITRIRRHRWPVEVYHEEGKAEGLDQYQLRDFEAIERHIAFVAVVYSLLRAAQQDPALQQQLQRQLQRKLEGSAAFWRRATQAQSLWSLALFISGGLHQGQSLQALMTPLLRAVCAG